MKVNLVLLKSGGKQKEFTLPSTVTTVGRRQDCDLCIPLMVVSRRHCQFNFDDGKLSLRDLGSANGTYVNGEQIDETDLSPGDRVQIGPLTFVVRIDGTPEKIEVGESILEEEEYKVNADEVDITGKAAGKDLNRTEIISPPSVDELLSE